VTIGFSARHDRALMARVRCWSVLLLGVSSFLACPAVFGQSHRISLVYAADPSCPTRADFMAQVKARTRLADFVTDASAEHRFAVSARIESGRAVGRLSNPSESSTERQVTSESCADVVSALALIAALAIDPHADLTQSHQVAVADDNQPAAALALESNSPAAKNATAGDASVGSTQAIPLAATNGSQAAAAAMGATASRWPAMHKEFNGAPQTDTRVAQPETVPVRSWLVGLGTQGLVLPSSPVVPLGGFLLMLERQSLAHASLLPATRLSVAHSNSATVKSSAGARARFALNTVELDLCPLAVQWLSAAIHGCLGIEGGYVSATGIAQAPIITAEQHFRPWWALHEQIELLVALNEDWSTGLDIGLAEPLWRDRFVFNFPGASPGSTSPGELLRTPPIAVQVAIRVARRFF